MAGAPKGNQNARKKPWNEALRRALGRKDGNIEKTLEKIADQVVNLAINGDWAAIQEVGNRLDGKAAQQQIVSGDEEGGGIKHHHTVEFVNGKNRDS